MSIPVEVRSVLPSGLYVPHEGIYRKMGVIEYLTAMAAIGPDVQDPLPIVEHALGGNVIKTCVADTLAGHGGELRALVCKTVLRQRGKEIHGILRKKHVRCCGVTGNGLLVQMRMR